MKDDSQMLKGILEGCILKIIKNNSTYGYEICLKLKEYGYTISEGSIYPILLRLERNGLLSSTFIDSPLGPKRKYYNLTRDGKESLKSFIKTWRQLKDVVEIILKGE